MLFFTEGGSFRDAREIVASNMLEALPLRATLFIEV